ncbi:inositol monophosphatase family protein [Pararhodonellum marinum]|uniref:inositol monophosphatase family protein n=1 Tax=Pararhodonellum marinum TaxID=2755358 RepID=UPI00188DFCB5|nr:inositol monophosphatase family protein [Pararhodonellum marinum]
MNYPQILEETKAVAIKAGLFIENERKNFDLRNVEHKGFNDLVSYVDKEAEQIIVDQLSKILPEAGFITEEETRSDVSDRFNWIIDPLDGTTNFIHGLPIFAVSIGLQHMDQIILGVVYEVNTRACYHALKGDGAYCNQNRIYVSPAPDLNSSLLATGFPYSSFGKIDSYLAVMKSLMQKTHGLRRLGSAAMDLCYVASGKVDGFFEYNLKPYDVAAGLLIVQEAGGHITDFKGGKDYLFGGEIIATNGAIHGELLEELKNIWKST